MSNNFISTILFLFLTITGFSQEFVKNFGQSSSESANDIIELSDGNLLIAGSFRDTISNTVDALLMKVDTNGVMIWSKTYGGIQGDDLFNSLIEDNGFIYACGYTTSFTTDTVSDVYLVKTDLNGNISWSKTYGGDGCAGAYCGDVGHKIIKEANNSYIISGRFASSGSNLMAGYILRINDTGNIVDEYIVDGVGSEWFANVSLAQNGDLLFSGVNKVSTWEPWLYRMHPTGYSVFNKGYGTVVDHNYGFGAVEYNKIFYLSNKAPNICLSKLNQAGDTLMVKEYGASAWIWSEDIFLSSDNNLFILANMGSQSLLMKTDLNGDTLWVNYFMNSGFTKKIIEKNNYLYLLGYTSSYGNGSSDITLMKVKSDGSSSNCYETTYPTFFTNPSSVLITIWAEGNTSFTTSNTISPTTTNVSLQECQACIIADFDFSINNNVVTFNNLTEQNVSYDWNFGDLNISSDENPSNTYLTYGIYNVCLVAYDSCSSNTMCKIIEVNNFGCTDTSANNYNP
ncbi:MAG: PKD domain-containing protein, partial [Flavobacteriales bacterium]